MVDWQTTAIQWAVQFGSIAIIILAVAVIGGIIIAVAWFRNLAKQYSKHKVIVWQEYTDASGNKVPMWVDLAEKGRIYWDKKLKKHFFHLKNANVRMGEYESNNGIQEITESNLPRTPYLKGGEVVWIKKLDHKTYAFAQPVIYEGKIKAIVTQADMAEAVASYESNIKQYGKQQNPMMALVMYLGLATLAMILVYIILQKADILAKVIEAQQANSDTLLEVVRTLKGSAVVSHAPG